MAHHSLHDRLEALRHRITAAEDKLRDNAHLRHEHHVTAKELRERHAHLHERLHDDVTEKEELGQHLTDLERSVQQWLDSIDTTHIASK